MKWRALDLLEFNGRVSYRRGNLVMSSASAAAHDEVVPLADVSTILIGLGTELGRTVLQQCCAFDVVVVPCSWPALPSGALSRWSQHTRVGARVLAQANQTLPRRKRAWAQVVRAKIRGQAATLADYDLLQAVRLQDLAKDVRSGDTTNIEAQAARAYWSRLFAGGSFSRDPEGQDDRNALLNYGYTVMRGHAMRAVIAAGLCPTLGMFHHGRSNPFALADDLIEPFRPAMDAAIAAMPANASLRESDVKHALVAAADQQFTAEGWTVSTAMAKLAQAYGNYVEQSAGNLDVPEWSGPQGQP